MLKGQSVNIEKIGLKNYLDETKDLHNGEGYDRFVFYTNPKVKISHSAIGRLMNVDRKTIDKWVGIHQKEQSNVR